jgi:hypothetical protein
VTIIPGSVGFLESPMPQMQQFINFALEQDISEQQRTFLEVTQGRLTAAHDWSYKASAESRQLLLFAVTHEDAQEMAQAYLDTAMEWYKDHITDRKREIQKRQSLLNRDKGFLTYEEDIAELESKIRTTTNLYEAMSKNTPYRSREEALNAVADLNALLNTILVDISGVRTTIDVIQDYQLDQRLNTNMKIRLEDMLIEQSISLKATLARQETATKLRDQLLQFTDLKASLISLQSKKVNMMANKKSEGIKAERNKEIIAELLEYMARITKPGFVNDTCTIYPVRVVPAGLLPSLLGSSSE